ncbi:hypothetical protein ACXO68_01445 [Lactobacillus delbrueckii subsp. bulgaricus]
MAVRFIPKTQGNHVFGDLGGFNHYHLRRGADQLNCPPQLLFTGSR